VGLAIKKRGWEMSTNFHDDGDSQSIDLVPENARKCPIGQNRLNDTDGGLNETLKEQLSEELNEQERTAVELLALGKSLGRVARFLQIDPKTLYRWRQNAAFSEAVSARRHELWSDAVERIRGMANTSLDILDHHLCDRYERIRFRAAQTVLNLCSIKKHASEAGDTDE
jgi:hypothetical protein